MNRRDFILAAVAAAATAACSSEASAQDTVTVYQSPTWGCCGSRMEHLRANGFRVKPVDVSDNAPYRARHGIPPAYAGCHTGVVGGYAIEGHVPAREIKRLLAEKPQAKGLAVAGMPTGSPGMEQGPRLDPYDVMLVQDDGRMKVYASYGK